MSAAALSPNTCSSSISFAAIAETKKKDTSTAHIAIPSRIPTSHSPFPNTPTHAQLPLHRPKPLQHPNPQSLKPPINPLRSLNPEPRSGKCSASDVLRLMDTLHLPISADIYASLILECTDSGDAMEASLLHAHIISSCGCCASITSSPFLNHRLLLMLVSCGRIDLARELFGEMLHRGQLNLISWAIMIVGFTRDGNHVEVIEFFLEMLQHQGEVFLLPPWLILCILKACVHALDLELGKQVHGCLIKAGHSTNVFLSSSLISFYGKCGIMNSDFMFDRMHHGVYDTVVWTSAIVSHCREGHYYEVLNVFNKMGRAGIGKNSYTFSSVLRACGRIRDDGWSGKQVHADAIKHGADTNSFVQCGLVDMYGKYGLLEYAEMVFKMACDKRNVACWNAMLSGYIHNGYHIRALKFLYNMKAAGMEPQESLLNEVRVICGSQPL